MKIKVCGITEINQLKQLDELGVDYAGMIFYHHSARYMLDKLDAASIKNLNLNVKKVGVFVNESEKEILNQVEAYGLNVVQLHGDESATFCKHISDYVSVIKVFRIKDDEHIDRLINPFEEFCDYYLFDTGGTGNYGGSGEKFNWEVLQKAVINKPFFLSGGIGLADVDKIKAFQHPFFYAVDINSRVELEPGIKDMEQVKLFLNDFKTTTNNII